MDWVRLLPFVAGMVDQELLARNEHLAARRGDGSPGRTVDAPDRSEHDHGGIRRPSGLPLPPA